MSSNESGTEFNEEKVPEHCPGPESDSAGKGTPCQGCPNQQICSSGTLRGPDPALEQINSRMSTVKHTILVLSGKGGVGKSTTSALLARAFATSNSDQQVALLDVDICGPSLPKMMGAEDAQVHQSATGWSPIYVEDNLCLMSIGFLLASDDDAVVWRGPRKNGIIKQFLKDVDWGELIDYLLIDTPPGTSDEHLSIVQLLLGSTAIDGAILVTTPQEVALLDVRKEVNFCRKVNIPILGVVENMASFMCPKCSKESTIFPASTGGAKRMCSEMGLRYLGAVPLDPTIGRALDVGENPLLTQKDNIAIKNYVEIADQISRICETI